MNERPSYPQDPFPAGPPGRTEHPAPGARPAVVFGVLVSLGVLVGLLAGGAVIAAGFVLGMSTGVMGYYPGDGGPHADTWRNATLLLALLAGLSAGVTATRAALT